MSKIDGLPIANIALAEIIDEVTNTSYFFDTAENAEGKPDLSQGKEDILRVKNRIIAMNRTEDICIGYDVKLKNNTFQPEIFAIIDGGTMAATGYEGPEVGIVTERHPFTLNLYSEQKDYDSTTERYVKFTFKHCKGKPVGFKFEDGKFYVPEMEAKSRPKKGEKPVYVDYSKALPDTGATGGTTGTVGGGTTNIVPAEVTGTGTGVSVKILASVIWTFANAIDFHDATAANFFVKKTSDGSLPTGSVTIDATNKIVTFVPALLITGTAYTAEAKAVALASGTGTTTAISTAFTTII